MTRLLRAGALAAAAPLLCAAEGDPGAANLYVGGLWIALGVLLALPAALLVHSFRPQWFEAESRALERRRTACVLVGAGLFVLAVVVIGAVSSRRPALGAVVLAPALAWFLFGFAGCARRQGERLTGAASGTRPLVVGWLARAGAFAVPLLWPVVGVYLVVVALGVPLVALVDRRDPPAVT